jgi:hypothetical protein
MSLRHAQSADSRHDWLAAELALSEQDERHHETPLRRSLPVAGHGAAADALPSIGSLP